jgi:Domain of Unknown Function with PDB structure (DUF3857)
VHDSPARLLALIILTSTLHLCPRDASCDDRKPITTDELQMNSVPEAPGAPAVILLRQVDRTDKLYGTKEYDFVRVKVLSEEGRNYANVDIPFVSGRYDITGVKGRTVHKDGSVANFDGKVYEKTIVKRKGLSYLAKTFTLPDVQVGSVFEYEYYVNYADLYLFGAEWILSEELFTKFAKFSMDAYTEHGYTVRWTWPAGLPEGVKPPGEQANGVIRMEARNIPAFQVEEYMPPQDELKYRVEFIYSLGSMEKDPEKFWKGFARKENDQVESFVGKRGALEHAVAETLSPADAPDTKLQKLYARAQKIRNLTYERRGTEEEKKHENIRTVTNVEELLNGGYGNKKQIDWLFLGLARTAGFQAYPVLLSNRKRYFFKKERMNGYQLSFTAVLVKVDGRDKFLDPGGLYAPYGFLPWEETGVPGLRLDTNGGIWLQTGLGDSSNSEIQRTADLQLSEEGTLEGNLRVIYTGQESYARRIDEMSADDQAREKFLEDEVKAWIPTGSEVELTNKPDWTSSAPSLIAEFRLKVPEWVAFSSKHGLLAVGLFTNSEKHIFDHAQRTYPIYFEHPFARTDDLRIRLPAGWQLESLPKPETIDLKAAQYDVAASSADGVVHCRRQLRIEFVLMEQKFYSPLRSFFQTVNSKDQQQIVLRPGLP